MMEKQDKKEVKGRSHIIYISIIGFLILSLTVLTVTFLIIHHINRDSMHSVSNHVEENSSKDETHLTSAPGDLNSNFKILKEKSKDIEKRSAHPWSPHQSYRPQGIQPRYRPHDVPTNYRPNVYIPRYYPGYQGAPVTWGPVTTTPTALTTPVGTTSIVELGTVTCFDNRPSDLQGASGSRGPNRQGSSSRGSSRRGSSRLDSNGGAQGLRGSPGGFQCRRVFYVLCDENSRRAAAGSQAEGVPGTTRSPGVSGAPGPPGPSRSIRYPVPGKARAPGGPRGAVRAPGSPSSQFPSLPEGVTCDLSNVGQPGPQGDNCRRVPDIICS